MRYALFVLGVVLLSLVGAQSVEACPLRGLGSRVVQTAKQVAGVPLRAVKKVRANRQAARDSRRAS